MQRIIQINIGGRVIPIEEDAYMALKDYIASLERQFSGEEGKDEIIQDIEYRIAELFGIRLAGGAAAIDREDVKKLTDTLGHASDIGGVRHLPVRYEARRQQQSDYTYNSRPRRLYRNPNDKILGGVCGGLGVYFDVDVTIIRLVFAACILLLGVGLLAYVLAWIIIPVARTPEELSYMNGGEPLSFHDIARNMNGELEDLKKRAEQMSRELRDFFSRKK
jgi:phage shock protein C